MKVKKEIVYLWRLRSGPKVPAKGAILFGSELQHFSTQNSGSGSGAKTAEIWLLVPKVLEWAKPLVLASELLQK